MATKKEKEILHDLLRQIDEAWDERSKALSPENMEKYGYDYACGYGYATLRDIQEELEVMLGISERYE